ncbi:Chlorophyll A-B binding protein [Parasponia andersonii]|uniref:Chlorophyll A-B binding protein n=1 Tax=Parasponia andersonii TaxID=3476 RepID=A0A2P5DQ12_PARAD|nr:Chlorophyll A-B binding protein [Parasponia andersonii]
MPTIPSSSLQLPNLFPLASSSPKPHAPKPVFSFTTRATDPDSPPSDDSSDPTPTPQPGSESDDFENRLSQVRLRYRSGTGKKAELRKTRKSKKGMSSASAGGGMYLPPVPLKEPVSGRVRVDFGFSPYSERVNGRVAMLGLTALVLVELATGKGVINYHTPAIVLIQVYFVAAVTALYVKYEKESVSVWPRSSPKE